MTEVYWISKLVVIEWALTDLDGAPVTDATVTGTITLPDGTTASATIEHQSETNVYRATYDPTVAGTHAYRLVATGTADSAEEGTFEVRASPEVAAAPVLDPTTDTGMVRLLVADTNPDALLLTDPQISALLLMESGSVKLAAAQALDSIASSEALLSKKIRTQDLSTDGPAVAAELRARATELRRQVETGEGDDTIGLDIVDFVDPWARRTGELTEWQVC